MSTHQPGTGIHSHEHAHGSLVHDHQHAHEDHNVHDGEDVNHHMGAYSHSQPRGSQVRATGRQPGGTLVTSRGRIARMNPRDAQAVMDQARREGAEIRVGLSAADDDEPVYLAPEPDGAERNSMTLTAPSAVTGEEVELCSPADLAGAEAELAARMAGYREDAEQLALSAADDLAADTARGEVLRYVQQHDADSDSVRRLRAMRRAGR